MNVIMNSGVEVNKIRRLGVARTYVSLSLALPEVAIMLMQAMARTLCHPVPRQLNEALLQPVLVLWLS